MNKNTLIIILVLLVAGVILLWARGSVQRDSIPPVSAPSSESPSQTIAPASDSVGNFNSIMTALSQNMELWPRLTEEQKEVAVAAVIELFAQQGQGTIAQEPSYYVHQIDQALATDSDFADMSLDRILLIFAVMAYDFHGNHDPDELALQVLGPEMYELNKLRLEQLRLAQEEEGA